jgi:ATP-dependent Lon protease
MEGPPGTGKISIAKSIAESLNRNYYRISFGGLDDVAELKGHRRTYIGAQPGKIVSALKMAGAENAVLLIDEIDKLGKRSFHGNPESAMLEILDPAQNSSFNDHYLDTTIDLSKVLFICTANNLGGLSKPLLDRMDIIQVEGYSNLEKKKILDDFILPKEIENAGLQDKTSMFTITDEVKDKLI